MKNIQKIGVHRVIFGVWSIFLLLLLISMHGHIAAVIAEGGGYVRLMELCLILGILFEYGFFFVNSEKITENKKRLLIFAIAFGIRAAAIPFSRYIPTNDFANYFDGACHFAVNGFGGGLHASLEAYHIPTFAGQAIINGCLLRILSPTLLGMQVLNSIYTAGICMMIYELGKEVNVNAALAGAVFYTFYPMSILSTLITTNTHGAVFFLLLGIYFYSRTLKSIGIKKRFLLLFGSAWCLVMSNFYHPSILVVLCAFIVYMLGCEVHNFAGQGKSYGTKLISNIRDIKGYFAITVAVLLLYSVISSGILSLLGNIGYMKNTEQGTLLGKIAVGLNIENDGQWNAEDTQLIGSYPFNEQGEVCMKLIKERLQNPAEVIRLMLRKTKLAWFGWNNYSFFYIDGIRAQYNGQLEQETDEWIRNQIMTDQTALNNLTANAGTVNDVFVYCVWILAVIGILAVIFRKDANSIVYLFLYVPLGWMAFIMISEMQPRYRYQGMTIVILMAGYGAAVFMRVIKNGAGYCKRIRRALQKI